MGILDSIDRLIFGAPVTFEKRSRYGLQESVERLTDVSHQGWKSALGIGDAVTGSIDPSDVRVWKAGSYGRDALGPPEFRGRLRQSPDGVMLVGTISYPPGSKLRAIFWSALSFVALYAVPRYMAIDLPPAIIWLAIAIIALGPILSRLWHAGDFQIIADAIDTALT